MKKLLCTAAVVLSAATLSHAQVSGTGLKKITAKHYQTGLQVGFWEVSNAQQLTLDSIGKRPTSRVGFSGWNSFEDTNGVYNFPGATPAYARAHNYGETVYGAINICFSDSVTPGKNTIPKQYPHDIANPNTEKAALKFLKNYVAYVLNNIGTITLTIDYEIMSNYRLYNSYTDAWGKTTAQRAADWSNWYVKAVRAARDTAAAMGMADKLKLMPIVNSHPLELTNPVHLGPTANPWLTKVVDSSDYLAFDTYQSDSGTALSSTVTTFKIIQFWIDSFSRNKDVIITENGYNVAPSYISGVNRKTRNYKTTGTIQQQDTFYRSIFDSLYIKCQPGGAFHGKLRSYNMWAICDNPAKDPQDKDGDYYFGIIGLDTADEQTPFYRPALTTVRNGIALIDSSSTLRPYDDSVVVNTFTLPGSVTYYNGDYFDYLRYRAKFNSSLQSYYLHVKTSTTGNLMISVNGKWFYTANATSVDIPLNTSGAPINYNNSANNVFDIYCTSAKFPFTQTVTQVLVNTSPTASPRITEGAIAATPDGMALYPNPAHTTVTIGGVDAGKELKADVFNALGQLVKTTTAAEINIAGLASGVYLVHIVQDGKTTTLQFVKE
jgi:hypothetical protein